MVRGETLLPEVARLCGDSGVLGYRSLPPGTDCTFFQLSLCRNPSGFIRSSCS